LFLAELDLRRLFEKQHAARYCRPGSGLAYLLDCQFTYDNARPWFGPKQRLLGHECWRAL